jgi:hypothetical protein
MKSTIKIIATITLVGAILIIGYFSIYFFYARDVENVKVKGYVIDKSTNIPIENVLVIITNERYEDDKGNYNYDEYLGQDKAKVYTNKEGYYEAEFKKSSFVWIKFYNSKYVDFEEKGKYAKETLEFKTYLTKK